MFSNISWSTYIAVVAVSLAAYYLYVGARYFSGSIKEKLSPTPKRRLRSSLPEEPETQEQPVLESRHDNDVYQESALDEYGDIEELIERIKNTIDGAGERNAELKEVKEYLHLLFCEYPTLRKSPFRASINEMVASEYNKLGKATLGDDDVDVLWEAV